jgi:hypothetical protein
MQSTQAAQALETVEEAPRRVLEGRAELIEDTQPLYPAVRKLLYGRRWRDQVRGQLVLLDQLIARDERVEQALELASQRMAGEGWGWDGVFAGTLLQTARAREELRRLVLTKLGPSRSGPTSLTALLRQLRGEVTASKLGKNAREAPPGEALLYEAKPSPVWVGSPALVIVMAVLFKVGWLAIIGMLAAWYLLQVLTRAHTIQLTNHRVFRKALLFEGKAIALGEIKELRASGFYNRDIKMVLAEGGMPELEDLPRRTAEHLLALLEIHRRLALPSSPEALHDHALVEATTGEDGQGKKGTAVLRPGYLAFLPEDSGADALAIAAESDLARPDAPPARDTRIPVPVLLEQLRHLPAARFDEVVQGIARRRGELWTSQSAQLLVQGRRVTCNGWDGRKLQGHVEESQRGIARELLVRWNPLLAQGRPPAP